MGGQLKQVIQKVQVVNLLENQVVQLQLVDILRSR